MLRAANPAMHCLECHADVAQLDGSHLPGCCGLTLQEYALRHGLVLDALVPPDAVDAEEDPATYPQAARPRDRQARLLLGAAATAGRVLDEGPWQTIPGEVRNLDMLLWLQTRLEPLGFAFRQEYSIARGSHRVVARNRLKRPAEKAPEPLPFADLSATERSDYAAAFLACCGTLQAGYVFCRVPPSPDLEALRGWLDEAHHIQTVALEPLDGKVWMRTRCHDDARRLIDGLLPQLREIPGQEERLYDAGPSATVVKELGFDAAHFITDHPGSCANLHGGHYSARFKIHDRIDPCDGFVMDYGDLKQVVKARVIEALDHHTLNYAAKELAWRSSTEFLAIWMWERLIDYLPALTELEIHETATSYCQYRGPSLEEFQEQGEQALLRHFQKPELGQSEARQTGVGRRTELRLVGDFPENA